MSVRGKALLLLAASLAAPAALADTVRPEVGKYLVQAEKLLNAQKYAAALHAVDEAQALGHLTPYETQVTAELRGAAAAGAGQMSWPRNPMPLCWRRAGKARRRRWR